MPTYNLQPYRLLLNGSADGRRIASKEQHGERVQFRKPVSEARRSKLYVLKNESEILYVGYTIQPIGTRLSYGFRAAGEKGYHGYKWKYLDAVELLVFVFESLPADKEGEAEQKLFYEAVEAELVFLIRERTGHWPKYQHEVHFNNEKREEVLALAGELYGEVI